MTKVLNVGRNTIYNRINLEEQRKREISESKKKEIISKIENIVLEYARYGYRRVTKELRKREGLIVNHKRVLQLMRENNLLCKAKRRFVVTTNSNHTNLVYPNLILKILFHWEYGNKSNLGSRYYLCPFAKRILLSSGDNRFIL